MKAVNLIPVEERRGAGSASSSAPTYGLLIGLTLLLVGLTAWIVVSNQVTDRRTKLAQTQSQAQAAEAAVARLKPYVDFASMEQSRMQTVNQLAGSRFDWYQSLHDLARVIDKNVWLSSVTGTVAPGVTLEGGASDTTGGLRAALPNPALSITGCATSTDEVVHFVSRLRVMNGVTRVSLGDAQKSDTASTGAAPTSASGGGGSGGSGGSGSVDCRNGSTKFPQFDVIVFYEPLAGGAPASATPGAGATPAAASASTSTPAKPSTSGTTPSQSSSASTPPAQSSPGSASSTSTGVAK